MHFARSTNQEIPRLEPGLWRVIAGFVVWSSAFLMLYVGHALACLYVPATLTPTAVRALLSVCWLAHLIVAGWLISRSVRQILPGRFENTAARTTFLWRLAFIIDLTAWGAILLNGLPVFAFEVCKP